ncbi:MAG TPA: PspC domain-containing protein [Candidatus Limnocylindrales bacterium]|nr:PspC domain-containing protein [Candidatus Limnocylindrales bacterium]
MTTSTDMGPDEPSAGAAGPGGMPPTPPGYGYDYEPRRLYRSTTDRVWAGVCGGLAEHFGWDPSITGLASALLTIFPGIFPMLIVYIVMAAVIPNEPPEVSAAHTGAGTIPGRARARRTTAPGAGAVILGVLLIVGGSIALIDRYVRIDWDVLWPAVAIGLGLLVILLTVTRREA